MFVHLAAYELVAVFACAVGLCLAYRPFTSAVWIWAWDAVPNERPPERDSSEALSAADSLQSYSRLGLHFELGRCVVIASVFFIGMSVFLKTESEAFWRHGWEPTEVFGEIARRIGASQFGWLTGIIAGFVLLYHLWLGPCLLARAYREHFGREPILAQVCRPYAAYMLYSASLLMLFALPLLLAYGLELVTLPGAVTTASVHLKHAITSAQSVSDGALGALQVSSAFHAYRVNMTSLWLRFVGLAAMASIYTAVEFSGRWMDTLSDVSQESLRWMLLMLIGLGAGVTMYLAASYQDQLNQSSSAVATIRDLRGRTATPEGLSRIDEALNKLEDDYSLQRTAVGIPIQSGSGQLTILLSVAFVGLVVRKRRAILYTLLPKPLALAYRVIARAWSDVEPSRRVRLRVDAVIESTGAANSHGHGR